MSDRCHHCGREGTVESVNSVVIASKPVEIQMGTPGDVVDASDQDILQIGRCTVCGEPTVHRYGWLDAPWFEPDDARDYRQIYPPVRDNSDLPARVATRYGAMVEVPHLPDAFAVRAGKVLEAICSDQGLPVTEDFDLSTRLDQLASRRQAKIPSGLKDQAHLVRQYRNVGGHDKDFDVEDGDVPLIRDFIETLLDYLYRGPQKLERGRQRLVSRQQRAL